MDDDMVELDILNGEIKQAIWVFGKQNDERNHGLKILKWLPFSFHQNHLKIVVFLFVIFFFPAYLIML